MHLYSLFSLRVFGLFRSFFLCFGSLPVLVCLSIDVTGALVLFFFLNSPPPFFSLFGVFVGFGVFVLFGGLWVYLSADVTGALPPLPPYPCARIPTRGLVHPLFHFSSLFSLSLRHSLFSLLCPCIYYV